ncbi:MAG: type II secretion system protein [Campylobacterota bacterium]|nr:type II secretion system protein [Campylobacterota bacterium]
MKRAFSLIELIFAIVIIGVLASVAIPKFSGLSDNAKISAELSTAASIQVALDACHGEWIINEGTFTCGASIASTDLNSDGYPDSLGAPLDGILKNPPVEWSVSASNYVGPASGSKGATNCKTGKPCTSKHWAYDKTQGTFSLVDN